VALIVGWFLGWAPSGGALALAGSLVYLAGIIDVTMVFNVPMSDALAAVQPDSAEGASLCAGPCGTMSGTVAGMASSAFFVLAF